MTELNPLFERVDGVVQCNIGLGDLVYAQVFEAGEFGPNVWLRVARWQTTAEGDMVVEGAIDQPTDTIPDGYNHGQVVMTLASMVYDHIPAEGVTDARIKAFFDNDALEPPGLPEEDTNSRFDGLHERLDLLAAAVARIERKFDDFMAGDGK